MKHDVVFRGQPMFSIAQQEQALTEEAKTANFKKWFGKSKVKHVVYHGTSAEFEAFEPYGYSDHFGIHLGTEQAAY